MMAKTAIIPPPNETTIIYFVVLTASVVVLHLLLIFLGSRKLSIQSPSPPVLQPALRSHTLPRPTASQTKTEPPPSTASKPVEDFSKRLEKIDQILNMLENQVKTKEENTQATEIVAPEKPELQPETSLSDVITLAKSLKEEIQNIMTISKLTKSQ